MMRKGKKTPLEAGPRIKRKRAPRRRKRRNSPWTKTVRAVRLAMLLFVIPIIVGIGIGGFFAFARGVPSIEALKQEVSPPSTMIFSDDDTLIGEIKIQRGKTVSIDEMPRVLLDAVVAVEDASFWSHSGIDYLAIMRAAIQDVMQREFAQGGSTITQQLAKMAFLTPEKKLRRKLKEFVLAGRIEKNLSKEEILTLYLNRAYFGHGAYGVEMAAQKYFGKSVSELTLPEAAMIAGLLKAPSRYSPFANYQRAKERQEVVLLRMEDEGLIALKDYEEARDEALTLIEPDRDEITYAYFIDYVKDYLVEKYGAETVYKGGLRVYTTLDRQAQAEAQRSVQRGLRDLTKRRGFRGPIDHVDLEAQEALSGGKKPRFRRDPMKPGDIRKGTVIEVGEKTARIRTDLGEGTLGIKDAEWAKKTLNSETGETTEIEGFDLAKILKTGDIVIVEVKDIPKKPSPENLPTFMLAQEPEAQGALVAIEPYSGYIRALVGGYDFNKSQYNRALRSARQVGSAFKPFVYAMALENGFTPSTIIVDEEITFENKAEEPEEGSAEGAMAEEAETKKERFWTPQNYSERYYGPTRLRIALAKSRNVVTVKLVDTLGIDKLIKFTRRMDIGVDLPRDLTLALGSMSITPLELTQAYGSFANGGLKMKPIGIKYVTNRRGKVIESNEPEGERVMDSETAFLMTTMLRDVVDRGTGWRARALGVPTAGKTGTTNEYRDAWFMGFTADMIAGVWVGFDEPKPLGDMETGSRAAAPIWVDFMLDMTDRNDPKDFPMPPGIVTRLIDPENGLLANMWTENAMVEYFREGTEPTEHSPSIWDVNNQGNEFF